MIRSMVRSAPKFTGKEEVIVLPLYEGTRVLGGTTKKLDTLCKGAISKVIKSRHFKGTAGETMLLALNTPKSPDFILLAGLGTARKMSVVHATAAGGSASRAIKRALKSAHILIDDDLGDDFVSKYLRFYLKGFALAQYRFKVTHQKPEATGPRKVVVMSNQTQPVAAAIRAARLVVEGTIKVRDLVNLPANLLSPTDLAKEARALAKENGFTAKIIGRREMEKLGMHAVLAVARGSRNEPKFIELHYNKDKGATRVVLVGKAVTFDTGGISIKPWMNMNEMKGDMGGGAVVLASIAAAASAKLPIEIIGLIPAVENMPDGDAFRPGDVIDTYAGKTIEVLSTDAEGRLILSDALAYGAEYKPHVMVDYATLTGAIVIALGTRYAGLFGNDQSFIDMMLQGGREVGELTWQLPLDDTFYAAVKGDISDYKNYSGRDGSSITAAALLGEFVGKTPWMHVDIAGTFWSDGKQPQNPKGATGYGVDLTLRFLEKLIEAE